MNLKRLKDISKTLLSLALGIAILWWLYRDTDMEELWRIIKSANFGIIAFSLIFGVLGNYFRGIRWYLFIHSLGYKPPKASIVLSTFGNYAVNFLLPRAGDVWRCGAVSKYDNIPFSKTVETFLIDKVLDIVAGLAFVLISFLLSIDFFISYFNRNPGFAENIDKLLSNPLIYLLFIVAIIAVLLMFTLFKNNKIVLKLKRTFSVVRTDLKLILRMKAKGKIILYTILAWLSFYLYFYICFYAFDFTAPLGIKIGWIVFAMSNIGVAVPVQGGVGTWHFMVISSFLIFGISSENANAFAGTVFTIQSVWTILVGIIAIFLLPYVKRESKMPNGQGGNK